MPKKATKKNTTQQPVSEDRLSADKLRVNDTTSVVTEEKRPPRIPMSGNRDILTVHGKEKGYVYRWFENSPARIAAAQAAWWDHVRHPITVGTQTVNTSNDSNSTTVFKYKSGEELVLLRIPEKYYKEDQAAKQKVVNDKEAAMKRNLNKKEDGVYGEVTIS